MERVVSRISNLYVGKVIAIHTFAILFITVCCKYLQDIYRIEKRIFASIIIIAIVIFLFTIWQELVRSQKIIVDEKGIEIYHAMSSNRISFSEIDEILTHKFKMSMSTIQITDGYTYSEIILKQKNSVIITPEKFDNYLEIMSAIKSNLTN